MSANIPVPYRSADKTVALPVGDREFLFPIPEIEDQCYAFRQKYEILRASFAALPLNTVSPDNATAFLQLESELRDITTGLAQWTRTYYQVPPAWDDFENIAYTFPGFAGYLVGVHFQVGALPVGRAQVTPPNGVKCRIHHDYFMVGSGQTYATAGDIPLIPVQQWLLAGPSYSPVIGPTLAPAAGLQIGNLYFLPTTPSLETSQAWIAAGTELVADCRLQRLAGNIWARVTRYVTAQ